MSTPDDELQKIFRENRKEFLDNKETPHFPPLVTQKTMVSTPSGSVEVDIKHPIETFPKCKPGENIKESPIENNGERVIGSQRDISLEKKVWQQKIQPINDRCLNGEFHYDPCPGVAELTDKSIALVHKMIFRLFNKLIYFPTQLTQMAPPIDQDRQAKELVLAFDDIVLKKLRAGLGTPNKNELFFDFLQDVYDCNLLPAFLTYLGHFCTTFTNSPEQGLDDEESIYGIISKPLEEAVAYIQLISCQKLKTDEIIQLLEKKNIRFDYPNLSEKQLEAMLDWLREKNVSIRVIALILDWPRIKKREVKLESTQRVLQRSFPAPKNQNDYIL